MISIDGNTYNAGVISLKRKAEFLDKYAERTEDGVLHRELIGVYFNYQLKLGWSYDDPDDYNKLWDKLTEPNEFHTVEVPDGRNSSFQFKAYFSNIGDDLFLSRNDTYYWKNLTVNFIAESPAKF